jgi:hypothetical protein
LAEASEVQRLLLVQDPADREFVTVRAALARLGQPAPLPVPRLERVPEPARIGNVEPVDTELARADVFRRYTTPDGRVLTFRLTQYYRRATDQNGSSEWLRTNTPASFWGDWLDWESAHLRVRFSERDQALVQAYGPQLEALLVRTCEIWGTVCGDLPRARLFLSGYVGSLEFNPLENVEVRVEFGPPPDGTQLAPDYFISVPSPHLTGVPVDGASERYLVDYLAVRLIASWAHKAAPSPQAAQSLFAQAAANLNLSHADPGFAAMPVESEQPHTAAAAPEPTAEPVVQRPIAATYIIQPGDTLLGIALQHGVTVDALASANGIANPDYISIGTVLQVPAPAGD